jgi:putative peptide maturation system protein
MNFEKAVLDAIPFLQALPRTRALVETVRARLEGFRAAHPGVGVELVVDNPPGCPDVDFDLLLQYDPQGTVAVGWRPDTGNPWSVQYSEHWASSLVLSVNEFDVTIQEALQALRVSHEAESDLPTRLVNYCLISAAIITDPPPVSDAELQAAADGFRAARGLHSTETTRRWLSEAGLSVDRFEGLLKTTVQARKLRDRITTDCVSDYFSTHSASLAKITALRAHAVSEDLLPDLTGPDFTTDSVVDRVIASASMENSSRSRICIETGFHPKVLPSIPPEAAVPPAGTCIGPVRHGGEYWCGRILKRFPPRLNQETSAFIQERLFASWLDGELSRARIAWHWM